MNPVVIGEFSGAFAASLGIAAIWLIITMAIPPLKKRIKTNYITAMVLAVLPQLATHGAINYLAAIACIILLVWQMKRAQSKLVVSNLVVKNEQP